MVLEDATQKTAANLDAVLNAAGLSTKHMPSPEAVEAARKAMQEIMDASYQEGYEKGYDAGLGE